MTKTTSEIRDAAEAFLEDWDVAEWTQAHGSWASEEWEEARSAYDEAKAEVEALLEQLPDGERVAYDTEQAFRELESAMSALRVALDALDGQVCPDESDYIAEGLIDPAGVKDTAEDLGVGHTRGGWDCREGWAAYRQGDALVIQWFRDAWGARHQRDLWVVVDKSFFEADAD